MNPHLVTTHEDKVIACVAKDGHHAPLLKIKETDEKKKNTTKKKKKACSSSYKKILEGIMTDNKDDTITRMKKEDDFHKRSIGGGHFSKIRKI